MLHISTLNSVTGNLGGIKIFKSTCMLRNWRFGRNQKFYRAIRTSGAQLEISEKLEASKLRVCGGLARLEIARGGVKCLEHLGRAN